MLIYILIALTVLVLGFLSYKFVNRAASTLFSSNIDEDFVLLEIQVPKSDSIVEIQTAPLAAEHMFASLHGLLRENYDIQEHFSFEITSGMGGIRFFAAVPRSVSRFLESQIYAQYPTAHISVVDSDYVDNLHSGDQFEVATLKLTKETFYPIKTFRDFEVDPLSAITSTLTEASIDEKMWFQLLLRPVPDVWQSDGYDFVEKVRSGDDPSGGSGIMDIPAAILSEFGNIFISILSLGFTPESDSAGPASKAPPPPRLSAGQELEMKAIEEKLAKMGFEVLVRVVSASPDIERARSNLRSLVASMKQFSTSNLNSFAMDLPSSEMEAIDEYKNRTFDPNRSFILNIEELASIFHLPSASVETPSISWVFSKKAEPPPNLPTQNCTYIGETLFRDKRVRFGLSNETDDRVRHMYLIGKSGTGKSTLFMNMIAQDIHNGFGVGVLDPHGELIENTLDYIPDERIDDVIIVDPSDTEKPVGVNLLEMEDDSQKNLMASGLVSAVRQHFDYSWGPRLEYLLNNAILTLLEVEGTTLLGITRLLEDMNYQKYILHKVTDPVIREFWEKEYKNMRGNQRLITEAVAPIQNKINRFLASTTIRNILGQRNSTIDIWEAMNSGKILLINLSKGKIGDDNSNLLGALLVSRIQFMAMQRVKIAPEQRTPFYLYVDEFQNFATGSFESILSESRKYKLGLYLTHQYTNQLPEDLLSAVYGNVGTIASFSLGAPDAKAMAEEFAPYFDENDLISLERFQIYIKLMIDGMTSKPFSARIMPPWLPGNEIVPKSANKNVVVEKSRQKYGSDRGYVENKIRKWVEHQFDLGMAIAEEHKAKNSEGE